MNWRSYLIAAALSAALMLQGCGSDKKKPEKKEKSGAEQTVDYLTGKTPLEAGQRGKGKLIAISITKAVNMYEVQEGKRPESLKELVDAGCLASQYTKDEWGRDLICSTANGKLVVRSMGADRQPNTQDDWVKEF